MSTCLDVAEAKYPSEHDGNRITPTEGRSLVPAFGGKPIERDALFWEHDGNRAVRRGKMYQNAIASAGSPDLRWGRNSVRASMLVWGQSISLRNVRYRSWS